MVGTEHRICLRLSLQRVIVILLSFKLFSTAAFGNELLNVQAHFDKFSAEPSACSLGHSAKYLQDIKAAKVPVCSGGSSSVVCTSLQGAGGGGGYFCDSRNVQLDMAEYVNVERAKAPVAQPVPVRAKCKAQPMPKPPGAMDEGAMEPIGALLKYLNGGGANAGSDLRCSSTVAHPVLLLSRYDVTNSYHHLETLTSIYMHLLTFPLDDLTSGVEFVIVDPSPPGFYLELHRRLSLPHRIRFAHENPYPPGTCFKQLSVVGRASWSILHAVFHTRLECQSSLFRGFISWLHRITANIRPEAYNWPLGQYLQAIHGMHGQLASDVRTSKRNVCKVTWISRRSVGKVKETISSWQAGRTLINNEDELVDALRKAVADLKAKSAFECTKPACKLCTDLQVQVMDLSIMRFYPEQLYEFARTAVLIGIHGAGMSNQVWLPDFAHVIEVMHNAGGGNNHYHNIAKWMGQHYAAVNSGGSNVNVDGVLGELRNSLDALFT